MRQLIFLLAALAIGTPAYAEVNVGTLWGFWGDSQTGGRAPAESSCTSSPEAIRNTNPVITPSVITSGVGGCSLAESNGRYDVHANKANRTWVHFQESGNQDMDGQRTAAEFAATFESVMINIHTDSPNAVISYETAFSFGREAESYRNWTTYNEALATSISTLQADGVTVVLADVDANIKALCAALGDASLVWYQSYQESAYHYTALGNFMVAITVWDALGYDVTALDYSGVSDINESHRLAAINIVAEAATSSVTISGFGGEGVGMK